MRTIAVIARKGGAGKTTVATHLAIGASLRGRSVLLADIDPQRSSGEVFRTRPMDPAMAYMSSSGAKLFSLQTQAVREGRDLMVIDTPSVLEEEIAQAVVLSSLSLLILRPTFLDIAAALSTANIIRQLRRPGLIVLNQAPHRRETAEPPAVKRALEALSLLRLPIAPVLLRSRSAYQTSLEHGLSVEEAEAAGAAAAETGALCDYLETFLFGRGLARGQAVGQ